MTLFNALDKVPFDNILFILNEYFVISLVRLVSVTLSPKRWTQLSHKETVPVEKDSPQADMGVTDHLLSIFSQGRHQDSC